MLLSIQWISNGYYPCIISYIQVKLDKFKIWGRMSTNQWFIKSAIKTTLLTILGRSDENSKLLSYFMSEKSLESFHGIIGKMSDVLVNRAMLLFQKGQNISMKINFFFLKIDRFIKDYFMGCTHALKIINPNQRFILLAIANSN